MSQSYKRIKKKYGLSDEEFNRRVNAYLVNKMIEEEQESYDALNREEHRKHEVKLDHYDVKGKVFGYYL